MALHSKKDFAKMCGIPTNALSVYVGRGKVVLSGDFVDDGLQQNRDFLDKRREKAGAGGDQVAVVPENRSAGVVEAPVVTAPKVPNVKSPVEGVSYLDLEKEKLALDIDKKVEEIELLKKKNEKLSGESIPTELVKMVFAQHSKSITSAFHTGADNFLMEISKKKELNRNEMAELRGELISIVNKAVDKSIEESRKAIRNIVNEYSEKKGVGERK